MKKQQTVYRSFSVALKGMRTFFMNDRNGRIQGVVALVIIVASFMMKLSATEWMFIVMCIAMVIITEMINASVEKVCDLISENFHPLIKIIKDVSAGAVLCSVIASIVIACIIFIPKLVD